MRKRVLMLYDREEIPLGCFDRCVEAAKYLDMKLDTLKHVLGRGGRLKKGLKLQWVCIDENRRII